jgi:hypothetical protein
VSPDKGWFLPYARMAPNNVFSSVRSLNAADAPMCLFSPGKAKRVLYQDRSLQARSILVDK